MGVFKHGNDEVRYFYSVYIVHGWLERIMAQCTHRSLYVLYIHITFICICNTWIPSESGIHGYRRGKGKNHVSNVYAPFF